MGKGEEKESTLSDAMGQKTEDAFVYGSALNTAETMSLDSAVFNVAT